MGAYVVYLVLVFGGSSSSSVVIPQALMQDCVKAGEKVVSENKSGFVKYFCVESLK